MIYATPAVKGLSLLQLRADYFINPLSAKHDYTRL